METKEEDLAVSKSNKSTKFDSIIGHIEDIIMEEEFQTMQIEFMEKHYQEFDDSEENKLSYTEIQKNYTDLIETYIGQELTQRMPSFVMAEFQKQLVDRKEELEGEVFEMLVTFSDFLAFKEMMLDFRAEKEGRTIDLSCGLTVTSLGSQTNGAGVSGLGICGDSLGMEVAGSSCQKSGNHLSLIDSEEPMVEGGNTPRSLASGEPVCLSSKPSDGASQLDSACEQNDIPMEGSNQ